MKVAVIITDSEELNESFYKYLKHLIDVDCLLFTYDSSELLSRDIINQADVIIIELMRTYNERSLRAEGILVGEILAKMGKKVLIISSDLLCDKLKSPVYWDFTCNESLGIKIKNLMEMSIDRFNQIFAETNTYLKKNFKHYLHSPTHHH